MIFDQPPKLWVPEKPAIIIPRGEVAKAMIPFVIPIMGGGASASTWNPADATSGAVLTVGNTVLNSTGTGTPKGARGTLSHSTGKWYFEITITGNRNDEGFGLANATSALSGVGNDADSWGLDNDGSWEVNHNGSLSPTLGASSLGTLTWQIACDLTGGKLYFGVAGSYYNGTTGATNGDPVAGTNPTFTSVSGTLFPIGVAESTTNSVTLNTNPSSPPSGYTNWG